VSALYRYPAHEQEDAAVAGQPGVESTPVPTWAALRPPSRPVPRCRKPGEGQVDKAVAYVLTHYHYSREPLDAALAGRSSTKYLKELTRATATSCSPTSIPSRPIGTPWASYQGRRSQTRLRHLCRVPPALRVRCASRWLLDQQPDLSKDESLILDDKPKSWAADTATLDDLWRKRIKNDVIDLMLDGKTWPQPRPSSRSAILRCRRASTSSRATTSSPIS